MNINPSMMRPQVPQQGGMDTGPQNMDALIQMIMMQQAQQGPQTTPIGQRIQDPRAPMQNPNVGTTPTMGLPPARFDQNAQPGLAGLAPRNIAPNTDNRQLGPSSPLMDMYRVPPSIRR